MLNRFQSKTFAVQKTLALTYEATRVHTSAPTFSAFSRRPICEGATPVHSSFYSISLSLSLVRSLSAHLTSSLSLSFSISIRYTIQY